MPYIIDEANFSRKLELAKENYLYTERLLSKGIIDYRLNGLSILPGYRFVKSLINNEYALIYKGESHWKTLYAVKIIFCNEIAYPQINATQVMVWKASSVFHKHVLDGLPQMFFIDLLNKHDIVISDSEQTVHGQRFWKKMLEWAFYAQYYIYVADGTKEEEWVKYAISSYEELSTVWESYVWDKDKDVHSHRLLVISKSKLLPGEHDG